MHSAAVYYLCLFVLLLAMLASWGATLFALPGNWAIVLSAVALPFCFRQATVAVCAGPPWRIAAVTGGRGRSHRAGRRSRGTRRPAPAAARPFSRCGHHRRQHPGGDGQHPGPHRRTDHRSTRRRSTRRLCRRISGRDSHRPQTSRKAWPPAKADSWAGSWERLANSASAP